MNLSEDYEKKTGKKARGLTGLSYEDYTKYLESLLTWIPVEERLPEVGERIICKSRYSIDRFSICTMLERDQIQVDDGLHSIGIDMFTHWLQLPPLPKEQ